MSDSPVYDHDPIEEIQTDVFMVSGSTHWARSCGPCAPGPSKVHPEPRPTLTVDASTELPFPG